MSQSHEVTSFVGGERGASEKLQWVKPLAAKPENVSSTPGTHIMGSKNRDTLRCCDHLWKRHFNEARRNGRCIGYSDGKTHWASRNQQVEVKSEEEYGNQIVSMLHAQKHV